MLVASYLTCWVSVGHSNLLFVACCHSILQVDLETLMVSDDEGQDMPQQANEAKEAKAEQPEDLPPGNQEAWQPPVPEPPEEERPPSPEVVFQRSNAVPSEELKAMLAAGPVPSPAAPKRKAEEEVIDLTGDDAEEDTVSPQPPLKKQRLMDSPKVTIRY